MHGGGDGPGNRIGNIQHLKRAVERQDAVDPENAQRTGAQNRDDHRRDGAAETSQHTAQYVHDAAEEIGGRDDVHADDAGGDDLGFGGVNAQQRSLEHQRDRPEEDADDRDGEHAQQTNPADAQVFARTEVLAGEGDGGLMQRVHGHVDEAFDVGGDGVSGHDDIAEAVDR